MGDTVEKRFVNLNPGPEGYKRIALLFEQQIKQSQEKIKRIQAFQSKIENWRENWYEFADDAAGVTQMIAYELLFDHRAILDDAVDAAIELEHKRIATMQEGLDEYTQGGAESDRKLERTDDLA